MLRPPARRAKIRYNWRMKTIHRLLAITLLVLLLAALPAGPALAQTETPVVHAVMFWMSTCPHCRETISFVLPPILEKYGEQFDLQMIEVVTTEDIDAFFSVAETYGFTRATAGVPFLIVGEQALMNTDNIRAHLPGLIDQYLEQGGVALPDSPLLAPQMARAKPAFRADLEPAPVSAGDPVSAADPAKPRSNGLGLALAVLIGLGTVAAYTLVSIFWTRLPLPAGKWADWALPVLCAIGLGVAAYLSYIEIWEQKPFCGPVGDCGAVQNSPYAKLLGVIPVGVTGLIGYVAILIAWAVGRKADGPLVTWAGLALFGMAVFGTTFSIYLTYLEVNVIKAVCIWCITSAILQGLVLLLSAGAPRRWLNPAGDL
jgi:uncharacterized membrane protein/thiol-disulfide isomerase/thioredoxin